MMQPSLKHSTAHHIVFVLFLLLVSQAHLCLAVSSTDPLAARNSSPVNKSYLPAQIGGIVGSYAASLVIVALLLLILSKRRRERLANRDDLDRLIEISFNPFPAPFGLQSEEDYHEHLQQFQFQFHNENSTASPTSPRSFHKNFSLPSNTSPISPVSSTRPYAFPSPSSTVTHLTLGVDLSVDQAVVAQDRAMAQQQLENMYKHVMDQEDARQEGRAYVPPQLTSPSSSTIKSTSQKERNKPASLDLTGKGDGGSNRPRKPSILSMLSPRRKRAPRGVSISSPVTLTPLSATFPRRQEDQDQEMGALSPRHYNPPPPPPVPGYGHHQPLPSRNSIQLPSPDTSPDSAQSIDERLGASLGGPIPRPTSAAMGMDRGRKPPARSTSAVEDGHDDMSDDNDADHDQREPDPVSAVSAVSERSIYSLTMPVGLPTSPKPGVDRFPRLAIMPPTPRANSSAAASPSTPTAPFQRLKGRTGTGGGLPLRAYEGAPASPSTSVQTATTKQTVFKRTGPLSPGLPTGSRTPYTGAAVPYSPYQPYTPVVPITPNLVTREHRKRMRKLEPKTPTLEMVPDRDELW